MKIGNVAPLTALNFMKVALWYFGLAIVIGVVAVFVYRSFGGLAAGIVVLVPLGLIANGWLAGWEDEQPGGFNNPHPPADTPNHLMKTEAGQTEPLPKKDTDEGNGHFDGGEDSRVSRVAHP